MQVKICNSNSHSMRKMCPQNFLQYLILDLIRNWKTIVSPRNVARIVYIGVFPDEDLFESLRELSRRLDLPEPLIYPTEGVSNKDFQRDFEKFASKQQGRRINGKEGTVVAEHNSPDSLQRAQGRTDVNMFPRNRKSFRLTARPLLRTSASAFMNFLDTKMKPHAHKLLRGGMALTRSRAQKRGIEETYPNPLTYGENRIIEKKKAKYSRPSQKGNKDDPLPPPLNPPPLPPLPPPPKVSVIDKKEDSLILPNSLLIVDDMTTIKGDMEPSQRHKELQKRTQFVKNMFQESANHLGFHVAALDQDFFGTRHHGIADNMATIRINSDFFVLHRTTSRQLRSLLQQVSTGSDYKELFDIISHSTLSPTTDPFNSSLIDFRVKMPSILLSNSGDTNVYLRIR